MTVAALLALDEAGQGRYYRFVGFASLRYDTHGVVIDTDAVWTRLVLPEWHPSLPVTVGTGTLPPGSRVVGAWVRCRANLGAEAAAQLEVDRILSPDPGLDTRRYPAVDAEPRMGGTALVLSAFGPGCGDIVLFVSPAEAETLANGQRHDVYLTGDPPPVTVGGRVYVHASGRVLGWRELAGRRPRPNGTLLSLDRSWQPCAVPARLVQPASGVADGQHGRQRWAWRSWPRDTDVAR